MISAGWNNSLTRALRERGVEHLVPLVNGVLVLALAYSFAQLTWTLWPAPVIVDRPALPASSPQATNTTNAPLAAGDIVNWHLFGKPEAAGSPQAAPETAPETPLNLSLRGVAASDDPTSAWAIIANEGGKESAYAINGELPGGAILKEIHADHVILLRNNRNETLSLPKNPDPNRAAALPAVPLPDAANTPPPNLGTPEINEPVEPDRAINPEQPEVGAMLRNYRDALAANPQSLIGLAQTEPVQESGKFLGYRLQPGSDVVLFQRLGLEPGDLVTAVNGVILDNPAKGEEAVKALATASQLQLAITRNGESKTLSFPIR